MTSLSISRTLLAATLVPIALSGCASRHGGAGMAGMGGQAGPMAGYGPHMTMEAMGCPHGPMDMSAMKSMTPEQHQAMMSKHAADCRTKLLAEGQRQARDEVRDCLDRRLGADRGARRKVARSRIDAAVAECTQAPSAQPATAPAHQH